MYRRLISSARVGLQPLVMPTIGLALAISYIARLPDTLSSVTAARAYMDPTTKQVLFLGAGLVFVCVGVFTSVIIAVGIGWLGSVYGKRTRTGQLILATPFGILGVPRQKIRLVAGDVSVHLVSDAPLRPFYRSGVQRVSFEQGDQVLRTASYVKYSVDSRRRLYGWFQAQGLRPIFDGNQDVLPGRDGAAS